ncbi:MAG: hypothetical protein Q8Q39_00260 [bacterium]|nr:hypothetical protein [bacterium]
MLSSLINLKKAVSKLTKFDAEMCCALDCAATHNPELYQRLQGIFPCKAGIFRDILINSTSLGFLPTPGMKLFYTFLANAEMKRIAGIKEFSCRQNHALDYHKNALARVLGFWPEFRN